jgi:hypothetical protein
MSWFDLVWFGLLDRMSGFHNTDSLVCVGVRETWWVVQCSISTVVTLFSRVVEQGEAM